MNVCQICFFFFCLCLWRPIISMWNIGPCGVRCFSKESNPYLRKKIRSSKKTMGNSERLVWWPQLSLNPALAVYHFRCITSQPCVVLLNYNMEQVVITTLTNFNWFRDCRMSCAVPQQRYLKYRSWKKQILLLSFSNAFNIA